MEDDYGAELDDIVQQTEKTIESQKAAEPKPTQKKSFL